MKNRTKQALEQPAQQCRTDGRCQYAIDSGAEGMGHCPKGKCVMPAQQQEPVAIVDANDEGYWAEILPDRSVKVGQPLYTSPPAQRKPLTDEEIHAIYDEVARQEPYMGAVTRRSIARAIEAAHNIKDNT